MMSGMEREPCVIAELEDLSSVLAPLNATTRIKYTCFNVSCNLLVMGASSGGLYVFRREPCVFLQLIPSKEGAVSQLTISADERLIGAATARGTVSLIERSQKGARVVASSYEHAGAAVTALSWGGSELFIGDAVGRVSVLARTVFQPPAALLMQLDSRIVQLDCRCGLLAVSTMTRCYVCDTEREAYKQVGQKLRDGLFGGCFLDLEPGEEALERKPNERARGAFCDSESDSSSLSMSEEISNQDYPRLRHLRLYCARPGARVWEGDAEGTVLKTHNFKEALATPPRAITRDSGIDNNNQHSVNNNQQPVNFGRLMGLMSRYLLAYTSHAIYVLDPERSDVVLWCNQIQDILDIQVTENLIYVWCCNGKMHALNLVPLEKFLIRMYFWKKYTMVAALCIEFSEYLTSQAPRSTKLHLLKDLNEKLKDCEELSPDVMALLAPLLETLNSYAQHTQIQNARKLQSGIFQITRPNYLNLKYRSHSVSPDRMEKLESGGSTSSLPELVIKEDVVAEEPEVEADKKLVASVMELCPRMSVVMPKNEEVRELLHRVLRLCHQEDPLTSPRELPLRKMFSTESAAAISKAFRSAITTRTFIALLKDLPSPSHIDCNDNDGVPSCKPTPQEPPSRNGDVVLTHKTKPKSTYLNKKKLPAKSVKNGMELQNNSINLNKNERLVDVLPESHPEYLKKSVDEETLLIDLKMSRALRVFGDILEESSILADIKAALSQCYYLSLLQITHKYEAVAMSLNDSLSPPRALSAVAFLLKVGQIEQICRWSDKLDLRDVAYLVMQREDKDGPAARVVFLALVDSWHSSVQIDLEHEYLVHCLETLRNAKACSCGFPVPTAYQQESSRFYNLGTILLESKKDPAEAVRVCGTIPWLWPHLLKMRADDSLLKLLPLILHLGDIEELERRLPELDSLMSEILVRHLAGLHRGDCLNCGRRMTGSTAGISWTQAALLLIKAVGHSEALRLLTQYKADVQTLDPTFHRAVVLAAIMEKHSTGLRHSVVDIFSGRNSQQRLLSPTLQAELFPATPITPGPSHWGLRLDTQALCPTCSLLLSAKVLADAGIVAFPCRHAYHAVCLRSKEVCPLCTDPDKC